ncbi:AbrB/MazE/SpoVT family DNA-binding domain-containing protein [Salinicoccus halitifaciens]|uniref:Antitoxin MazE n=1 Tax=Salinicoccus halitifaciens TaxID=1073415 RepID=A0ABV2E6Y7_9STAP|nr:AbrB/MazE/SpoVT family DNA-binding domain-containing protein [Salinicoccus halitifaciens]MCD2136758.1 AbrB/MazE/SpoVT family DNA-binding domain-containing protein [Salinicoccus halitifaciens]
MMKVSVNRWGNSKGIRLPKAVTEALEIEENDSLNIEIKDGAVILSKPKKEITIEEMFKDYKGGSFQAEIQEFEPEGNEKW